MLKRLIIMQLLLLGFQIITYFGCEILQKDFHDVKRPIDDRIPFLPFTALPYCLWFPLIALFPLAVWYASPEKYVLYMVTMVLEIVVSVACYLVYPTTFTRPQPPSTFWGNCMRLVYKGSYRGVNCAPSLHCSSCYLVLYCCTVCGAMPTAIRLLAGTVAFAIVISTVTTKQHTVIDVTTAVPLFLLCLWLAGFAPQGLTHSLILYIQG